MAPVPEAFFPSLDKCFSGDVQLLSWRRAFLYVTDPDAHADDGGSVSAFLSHPESIQLLSQSLKPFSPPSAKSKSEFESKTAVINVETSKSSFDLKEIKADAQWLSDKAKVDEITALRITILEWQNRPATRLTAGFSSEEATSLQSATGVDNLRASVAGPLLANILKQATGNDGTSFDTEATRRLRLRKLYLLERGHILKTFRKLLVLSQHEFLSCPTKAISLKNEGKIELSKLGATLIKEKSSGDSLGQFLEECISAIRNRLTDLNGQGGWLGEDESNEEIENIWRTDLIEEIVHILQIIFHLLQASTAIPSGALFVSWLTLMADFYFLENISVPCEQPLEVLLPLQSLVSLTTLAFLKLPLTIPFIIDRVPPPTIPSGKPAYFLCKDNISQINEILVASCGNLATVNPAALSWGLILYTIREYAMSDKETRELEQFNSAVDSFQSNTQARRSSKGSEPSQYEDLLEFARTPNYSVDEAITLLTCEDIKFSAFSAIVTLSTVAGSMSAVDDNLTYQWIRLALLDLIRTTLMYLDYTEVLDPILAILAGSPEGAPCSTDSLGPASDPKCVFVEDTEFMHFIFRSARSRFPFETIPFLKLCRALISEHSLNEDGLSWIFDELEKMETFTQVIGPNFHGYETIREDENANYVSLTQSLPMFDSHHRRCLPQSEISDALVVRSTSEIPTATIGQVVSEQKPTVIQWEYRFSCLTFLGSWLEEWSESGGEFSSGSDVETATEIIGLLADLVSSAKDSRRRGDSGNSAKRVLEMASDGLSRQGDIISVVLNIFERNLQNIGSQGDAARVLDPIMACLQFIQAVLMVIPGRVWPFLSRSSFIGSDGKGGILSTIISATEIPSGEYPFLLTCVNLLDALVDDAASRAVLRKIPGSVSGKSTIAVDWSASIPSHIMRTIVLNLTRTMVEIYNSNGNWRFNLPEQRFKLNGKLADTFDRILYYAYGVNDSSKLELKATGVFSSSATYLLDILRPRSTADLPFNPLLRLIAEGLETPPTRYLRYLVLIEKQIKSTLALCVKLVQAARLLELSESLLEEQLFKATPVLVKLYALHDSYKLPVVSLLDILISSAASSPDNEPPSLVGYLGAESSCLFLDVLSQLNQPLSDRALLLSVWQLLSSFVSQRQQWMAVFILTGSSPRQALKKTSKSKDPSMRGVPFLQMALERLSHIDQEEPQVALALLNFVSQAQEHWPWATPQLKSHPHFLNSIVNYVSKLKFSSLSVSDQIFTTRIAAVVTDICAVYLHAAKESNDWGFVKTLIPLVQWYAKTAVVDVSAYNNSLHTNLKKNFEKRYSGCKIVDLKRTPLQQRTLGRDYYYDLGMAEKMLSYDFAWAGTRGQSISEEFERANINLSLVEAQVGLLNSWKYFAMEHCADFMPDREIQKSMALVAQQCLEANTRPVPAEAIFERIQQVRVDFAQALLQRLVQIESRGSEVFGLLEVTWTALRGRHATYEEALINDDTEYYRSLLNVLFLALQFHVDGPARATPAAQPSHTVSSDLEVIVEIVKVIVAQGFRSLTTYVHEQREKCQPKDFAIIIAILQTSLRVKNADRLYDHITYHIEDNDTVRQATSLFSWADKLLEDGDPIYGELSLSILVKLSSLPDLAEHLAVEAVLSNLSACKLTNILAASKGCGPFQAPRLYSIWTAGFLPLCLNLLHNVIRAAPEVAAFLNQFVGQLDRASEAFSTAHAGRTVGPASNLITLSMASEAYSLSLISFIIDGFREAGASAGLDAQSIQPLKWDKAPVKEDIEGLVSRPANLRRRIAATTEKEVEWSRQKPVDKDSGAESRLEEKILNELKGTLACLE